AQTVDTLDVHCISEIGANIDIWALDLIPINVRVRRQAIHRIERFLQVGIDSRIAKQLPVAGRDDDRHANRDGSYDYASERLQPIGMTVEIEHVQPGDECPGGHSVELADYPVPGQLAAKHSPRHLRAPHDAHTVRIVVRVHAQQI